jgi:hypothetical protein
MAFTIMIAVACLIQLICVSAYMPIFPKIAHSKLQLSSTAAPVEAPTAITSRLKVTISGPSITSAQFRSELKKELVFNRGCKALFYCDPSLTNICDVTCEGKTIQISRFLVWLEKLSIDVSLRKASFQGPNLIAYIDKITWSEFEGW